MGLNHIKVVLECSKDAFLHDFDDVESVLFGDCVPKFGFRTSFGEPNEGFELTSGNRGAVSAFVAFTELEVEILQQCGSFGSKNGSTILFCIGNVFAKQRRVNWIAAIASRKILGHRGVSSVVHVLL